MTTGVVSGQFVIAICQGLTATIALQLTGFGYFFFLLLFTFLSIIPLGAGILVVPIGVLMILSGNVGGGIFLLLVQYLLLANIDNVLRPLLIPKLIRLNFALLMLSVFGGLSVFGFMGIAVGPIIMVLVITTVQMYVPYVETRRSPAISKPKKTA